MFARRHTPPRLSSLSVGRLLSVAAILSAAGAAATFVFDDDSRRAGHASASSSANAAITGRATVVDGDTLDVGGRRIRLHGIDAPERNQSCLDAAGITYGCGRRAAAALASRIGREIVTCQPRDTDRYGRVVAVCRAGGEDVNAWLVREGWAVAYRRYSIDYVGAEAAARSVGRGIWAGSFTLPEAWRHARP